MLYFVDIGMISGVPFGIEKAQIRRQRFLDELSIPYRYIALKHNPNVNQLQDYKENGYDINNVQLMLQVFTDLPFDDYSYDKKKFLEELPASPLSIEENEETNELIVTMESGDIYRCLLFGDRKRIFLVKHYEKNSLKEVDYYSTQKYLSIIYKDIEQYGVHFLENSEYNYYNSKGEIVLKKIIDTYTSEKYVYNGKTFDLSQLLEIYFQKQGVINKDVIVFERIEPKLYSFILNHQTARIAYYLHETIENYDGEVFGFIADNLSLIGRGIDFVLSTEIGQPDKVRNYVHQHFNQKARVYFVPVMHVEEHAIRKIRKRNSFLSVSNLVPGKGIKAAIEAIVRARKIISDISYDIYGDGILYHELQELIDQHEANDYIQLKGFHKNIMTKYSDYEAYLASSYSEAFATTLVEAMNQGVALIARGNVAIHQAYVDENKNGYLINNKDYVNGLAEKIVRYCRLLEKDSFAQAAYDKSLELFSYKMVQNAWKKVIVQEQIESI